MFVFKTKHRPIHKNRKSKEENILERLNSYLKSDGPELVYFLKRLWNDQKCVITYKELRQSFLYGELNEKLLENWRHDYSVFVKGKLMPAWMKSMEEANKELKKQRGFIFDPTKEKVLAWIKNHGAEWVMCISNEQRSALQALISYGYNNAFGNDELAKIIRPCIGLNRKQAEANLKYYNHVKRSLFEANPRMKPETVERRAREAAIKYSERQLISRAEMIAHTEMSFSYNWGAHEGVRQAQAIGLMGRAVKVWRTSAKHDVCSTCAALEGVEMELDGEFDFPGRELFRGQKQVPPAHPRCHCVLQYKEIDAPQFTKPEHASIMEVQEIRPTRLARQHTSVPLKAGRNDVFDIADKESNSVLNRSFYDENGRLYKQINTDAHGNHAAHPYGKHGEHAHDFIYSDEGKLLARTIRELTKLEREANKAILGGVIVINATYVQALVMALTQDVVFDYEGKTVCVNPVSQDKFILSWGDEQKVYYDSDTLMQDPILNGKSLEDVCNNNKIVLKI